MKWTCIIPGYFPPSPNSIGDKAHWSYRNKIRQDAFDYLSAYGGLGAPQFDGAVSVTITRRYSGRGKPMDKENLYAATKPLTDAMRRPKKKETARRLGIIEDDTDALLDLDVKQERADVTETIIEVESA